MYGPQNNFGLSPINYGGGGFRPQAPDNTEMLARLMARQQKPFSPVAAAVPAGLGLFEMYQGYKGLDKAKSDDAKDAAYGKMATGLFSGASGFLPERTQPVSDALSRIAASYTKNKLRDDRAERLKMFMSSDKPEDIRKAALMFMPNEDSE
jgi:hypothetical protein